MKHATKLLFFLLLPLACGRPTSVPQSRDSSQPQDHPAPPIRVLTFNIRYGTAEDGPNSWAHRRNQVSRLVRKGDYDLIGLQEALRFQLDEIMENMPEHAMLGVGRDDGKYAGEYAALLVRRSRFDIVEHGQFWLSETPDEPGSIAWDAATTRICTWARLRDRGNGRLLRVYNTHLDYKSQLAREKAVDLILLHAATDMSPEPTVIMGDFNAGEKNPAIESLLSAKIVNFDESPEAQAKSPTLFVNAFRSVQPNADSVGTYHAWTGETAGEMIDHIFATRDLTATQAEILHNQKDGRFPSDHFPVRVTLEWSASN